MSHPISFVKRLMARRAQLVKRLSQAEGKLKFAQRYQHRGMARSAISIILDCEAKLAKLDAETKSIQQLQSTKITNTIQHKDNPGDLIIENRNCQNSEGNYFWITCRQWDLTKKRQIKVLEKLGVYTPFVIQNGHWTPSQIWDLDKDGNPRITYALACNLANRKRQSKVKQVSGNLDLVNNISELILKNKAAEFHPVVTVPEKGERLEFNVVDGQLVASAPKTASIQVGEQFTVHCGQLQKVSHQPCQLFSEQELKSEQFRDMMRELKFEDYLESLQLPEFQEAQSSEQLQYASEQRIKFVREMMFKRLSFDPQHPLLVFAPYFLTVKQFVYARASYWIDNDMYNISMDLREKATNTYYDSYPVESSISPTGFLSKSLQPCIQGMSNQKEKLHFFCHKKLGVQWEIWHCV